MGMDAGVLRDMAQKMQELQGKVQAKRNLGKIFTGCWGVSGAFWAESVGTVCSPSQLQFQAVPSVPKPPSSAPAPSPFTGTVPMARLVLPQLPLCPQSVELLMWTS